MGSLDLQNNVKKHESLKEQFPPSMRRNSLWLYKYLLCKLCGALESFKS